MYTVDEKDRVVPSEGIPEWSVGAPLPVVFSEEGTTIIAYIARRAVSPEFDDNVFVKFRRCYAQMFGPPNDEAFHGHPLADRGLESYQASQVENSSWLRQMERMNSVHPYHDDKAFERLTHYVLGFHDSTFECLAESFDVKIVVGPLRHLLEEIDIFLGQREDR